MRRGAVQVEPVLLHILAVVALAVVQAEHPLLENRVGAIPQRQRQAQTLTLVTDPGEAVLTPPVSARPRLLVREVVPRIPPLTVVLPHRRPLPLRQIRTPRLPRSRAGASILQALMLRGVELRWSGRHGFGASQSLKRQLLLFGDPAPTVARRIMAVVRLRLRLTVLGFEWAERCTLGRHRRSSRPCRCDESLIGPVIAVVPLRAETVIASKAGRSVVRVLLR